MKLKLGGLGGFGGLKFPGIKILDRYIIRKFLGTYLFSIAMFVIILVIFDYAEKVDDFITNKASFRAIALQYYLNFIPSFINQFSGLLTFIGVIFFTSKMAYNTEIVAMLSSGESFRRLMWPYFVSATAITALALALNLWIIPPASEKRIAFETQYITRTRLLSEQYDADIYRQIGPSTYAYLRDYDGETGHVSYLSIERYVDNRLSEVLEAAEANYIPDTRTWAALRYTIRRMPGWGATVDSLGNSVAGLAREEFTQHELLDTLINLNITELGKVDMLIKSMKIGELNRFVGEQKETGSDMMAVFEVERQSRFSYPAAIYILTLIGVSLSSRKVRGGTGLHIGMGITLCFAYILLSRFAEEFAKGGILPAGLSVWLPNILFAAIAVWLYVKAPK